MVHNLSRFRWAALALLPVLLSGCDGHIGLQGQVYTLKHPDSTMKSTVYEVDPALSNSNLIPLANAQVMLIYGGIDSQKIEDSKTEIEKTDAKGRFTAGGASSPVSTLFTILVTKDIINKFNTNSTPQTRRKICISFWFPGNGVGPVLESSLALKDFLTPCCLATIFTADSFSPFS